MPDKCSLPGCATNYKYAGVPDSPYVPVFKLPTGPLERVQTRVAKFLGIFNRGNFPGIFPETFRNIGNFRKLSYSHIQRWKHTFNET